jgi:ABC-type sugar transport system ATPase subunit
MDMRTELKRLHHISDATTVYVTHDQMEAMTMSPNIAVMKEGVIQQLDTPDRVYHFPANLFVADFIGNPKINLLEGWVSGQDQVDLGRFNIPAYTYRKTGDVVAAFRPEDICVHPEQVEGGVEFSAYSVQPAGADTTIIAHKGDTELIVKEMGVSKIAMDQRIWLTFNKDAINLYDKANGKLVTG